MKIWDSYSSVYGITEKFLPYNEHVEKMLSHVKDFAPKKVKIDVLDIGSGTGFFISRLARMHNINATVIDISKKMLKKASTRIREKHPSIELSSHNLDICDPDCELGKFDVVILNNVFYALNNTETAVKNISYFLKKDGIFIFSDPKPDFSYTHFLREHYRALQGINRFFFFLETIFFLPLYLLFFLYNLAIDLKAKFLHEYHYYSKDELLKIFAMHFLIIQEEDSYADQSYLFVLKNK